MKVILFLVCMFSVPTMANEITCSGKNTKSKMILGLTEKEVPLDKAVYSYNGRDIPINGYQFGIESGKEGTSEKLVYKFQTLKRHKLAEKKAHLIFTISESGSDNGPFIFTLRSDYVAQLAVVENGVETILDLMTCDTTKP